MRHGIFRFRARSGATHFGLYDRGRLVEVWKGKPGEPQGRASVKKLDHDSITSVREEIRRRENRAIVMAMMGERP